MNVLHTADWHIGKMLHQQSLKEEMEYFIEWLLTLLEAKSIDVLLISGDIFDQSNPAAKDRQLYYGFLSRLIPLDLTVVITGGNHDSIAVLNAPKDILSQLKIIVVGGAKDNIAEELIEIKDRDGELALIVAAVPFLRDRDLRRIDMNHDQSSRIKALRSGIKKHYDDLAKLAKERYPDIPLVGMGHLFARGSITSESERNIHIGNAAAIEASTFSSKYDYMALGHLHRPQSVAKNKSIRYSGSPIALSFSERSDHKEVLIISVDGSSVTPPSSIPIPKYRSLTKLSGTMSEVTQQLEEYEDDFILPAFIELEINEQTFSNDVLVSVNELIHQHKDNLNFRILKHKISFETGAMTTADLFAPGITIEELKPEEVFLQKLRTENTSIDNIPVLTEAFNDLLNHVYEQEDL